jgi:hypothetical protein
MKVTMEMGVCANGGTATMESFGTPRSGWIPTTILCLILALTWQCGTRPTYGRCVCVRMFVCASFIM